MAAPSTTKAIPTRTIRPAALQNFGFLVPTPSTPTLGEVPDAGYKEL
jgi:hypothetical protein